MAQLKDLKIEKAITMKSLKEVEIEETDLPQGRLRKEELRGSWGRPPRSMWPVASSPLAVWL